MTRRTLGALASFVAQPRSPVVDALCDPGEFPISTTVEWAQPSPTPGAWGPSWSMVRAPLPARAELLRDRLVAAATALQARARPW